MYAFCVVLIVELDLIFLQGVEFGHSCAVQSSVCTEGPGIKQNIENYFLAIKFLSAFYLSKFKPQTTKCRFNSTADSQKHRSVVLI